MYESLVNEMKNDILLKEDMPSENMEIYKYHLANLEKSLELGDGFKTIILGVNEYCLNGKIKMNKTSRTDAILGLVSLCSKDLQYEKFTIGSLRMLGFYAASLTEDEIAICATAVNNNEEAITRLNSTNTSLDEQAFYLEEYVGNYNNLRADLETKGIDTMREEHNYPNCINEIKLEGKYGL